MPLKDTISEKKGDIKKNKGERKDRESEGAKENKRIARETKYAKSQQTESDEERMSAIRQQLKKQEEEGMLIVRGKRKKIAPKRKREAAIETARKARKMESGELDESGDEAPNPLQEAIDKVMRARKDTV